MRLKADMKAAVGEVSAEGKERGYIIWCTEGLGLINLLLPNRSPAACSLAEHQQEQTVLLDSQEVLAVEGVVELRRPMCAGGIHTPLRVESI
jgi:hypothetical protein